VVPEAAHRALLDRDQHIVLHGRDRVSGTRDRCWTLSWVSGTPLGGVRDTRGVISTACCGTRQHLPLSYLISSRHGSFPNPPIP